MENTGQEGLGETSSSTAAPKSPGGATATPIQASNLPTANPATPSTAPVAANDIVIVSLR